MKLVLAKFYDPTTFNYWAERSTVEESRSKICYAGGFLVSEGGAFTKIALLVSESQEEFSGWITIPKKSIIEMTVLREVDWRE